MNGFGRLAAFIVSRPGLVGALLGLIVVAVTAGVVNLQAEFDVRLFYDHSDEELPYLQQYQERWGEDLRLVLVVDGGDTSVLTKPRLKVMEALMERMKADPAVTGVIGPPNMPRPGPMSGSPAALISPAIGELTILYKIWPRVELWGLR